MTVETPDDTVSFGQNDGINLYINDFNQIKDNTQKHKSKSPFGMSSLDPNNLRNSRERLESQPDSVR